MSFTADTWTLRHQFFFNSYKCVHAFRQEPLQTETIVAGKVFPLQFCGVYKSNHGRCSVHAGPVVGGVVAYCSVGTDRNINVT